MNTDIGHIKTQLEDSLFADAEATAFAVLDGSRNLETYNRLQHSGAPNVCLFGGDLDPEVLVTAPHLVELNEDDDLFDWIFEGWGDARGIFLTAQGSLSTVRKQLRSLIYAEMPDGEMVIFRFYDPRALRSFFPMAEPEQRAAFFGDVIDTFVCEAEMGASVLNYSPGAVPAVKTA